MIRKKIKQFIRKLKKTVPRVIINPDKCFSDEEFELRKNGLTQVTIDGINDNFQKIVAEVVSIAAENNKIYIECISTIGTHFITILTLKRRK